MVIWYTPRGVQMQEGHAPLTMCYPVGWLRRIQVVFVTRPPVPPCWDEPASVPYQKCLSKPPPPEGALCSSANCVGTG